MPEISRDHLRTSELSVNFRVHKREGEEGTQEQVSLPSLPPSLLYPNGHHLFSPPPDELAFLDWIQSCFEMPLNPNSAPFVPG